MIRPGATLELGYADETKPDCFEDGDYSARRAKFSHGVLDMKINSILTYRENHPDIPRGLALRRPVQAISFALGQSDRWSIQFGAVSDRRSIQFGAVNDRRQGDVEQT